MNVREGFKREIKKFLNEIYENTNKHEIDIIVILLKVQLSTVIVKHLEVQ